MIIPSKTRSDSGVQRKGIEVDKNKQKESHGEGSEKWLGFGEVNRKRKGHGHSGKLRRSTT